MTELPTVREEVAAKTGVSTGQLSKVETIFEKEEEFPEVVKRLESEEISVNKAYQLVTEKPHEPSSEELGEPLEDVVPVQVREMPRQVCRGAVGLS